MRTYIRYQFEDGDMPSPKDVREAFNLLMEFTPALRDKESPIAKAFHNMVDGRDFTREHFITLKRYAMAVVRSAEEKYNNAEWREAPWREAVLQNCAMLRGLITGMENIMNEALMGKLH